MRWIGPKGGTDTFATISTKKSFSLISHDAMVLESRSTLPDRDGWIRRRRSRDEHTRIDQLLRLHRVGMGLEDLFLEFPYGVLAIGVDLGACSTSPSEWGGVVVTWKIFCCSVFIVIFIMDQSKLCCVTSCVIIRHVNVTSHNRVSGVLIGMQQRGGSGAATGTGRARPRQRPRWSQSMATSTSAKSLRSSGSTRRALQRPASNVAAVTAPPPPSPPYSIRSAGSSPPIPANYPRPAL